MPKKLKAIKNWDELPDMILPQDYADVMGISLKTAYEKFNKVGFPKVTNGRVSKSEVMKYLGIKASSDDLVYNLLKEMTKDIKELKQELQEQSNQRKELLKVI